jgi:hydroxymethylbilane synthase
MKSVRIGTRGSALALAQANWVKERIERKYPDLRIELVMIKTTGDRLPNLPVQRMGGKGIFVKEIEESLLRNEIDLAVHSLKDLPTEVTPDLTFAAIPEREDPGDALVSSQGRDLRTLDAGARIGTGSLRRRAQVLHFRRDVKIVPIRGNVDTRLKKLDGGEVDGLILAVAGLKRIGKENRISEYLPPEICVGAPAQGALCLQTRAADPVKDMLSFLHDVRTAAEVTAERAFLRHLGGGCNVPVGARANTEGARLRLVGMVADPDGLQLARAEISGLAKDGEFLGKKLAEQLSEEGVIRTLPLQS